MIAAAGDRFVAVVGRRGRFLVAEPLFERRGQVGLARGSGRARAGEMALVERASGGARILAELGRPDVARDVVGALLADRGLRPGFPRRLEDDAREAAVTAGARNDARRDLTRLATFTVDPASARDFDDAVSAEADGDRIRLWIHIADVAAHVRPGTALDAAARERANSTYVPGTVVPMLPEALSGDACSLAPHVERLAVTAEILLKPDGEVASASFYRSRIRSDERLNYDQLDRFFGGTEAPPASIAEPLELARRAAATLAERRVGSALDVSSTEPEFEFDEDGHVTAARAVEQTEAHSLIEQLMILTNEGVAQLCERRGVPTLYRVHEQPDPSRIAALVERLAALDIPTPPLPENLAPREAGELAAAASRLALAEAERRGHGAAAYTSLVLRSLKPAFYTNANLGHAGLGSPAYSHFTSPIRRYPDLIAHRALLSLLGAGEDEPDRAAVREAGPWCSEREREAMVIERDADKVCASFLLERELFEGGWKRPFDGEVSGVIAAGAFVRFGGELGDVYEGFVPARRLRGERFELNQTETALVGTKTGRTVRLGDPLRVLVDGVEAARGRVDLLPFERPDDER
ncbi:MAG TPA: RNB domain-containing ribonuclease [Solirubrobacterales bacterium]|nr:RNB domain-containing ribonuclease [Solirubrobacterales bacterium]